MTIDFYDRVLIELKDAKEPIPIPLCELEDGHLIDATDDELVMRLENDKEQRITFSYLTKKILEFVGNRKVLKIVIVPQNLNTLVEIYKS